MKFIIKRIKNDTYFNKHIADNVNHWTYKEEAKIFKTETKANETIKEFNLKNVEIEKVV